MHRSEDRSARQMDKQTSGMSYILVVYLKIVVD